MTSALWSLSTGVYSALALDAEVLTGEARGLLLSVISTSALSVSIALLFAFALTAVFTHVLLALRAEKRVGTAAKFSAGARLHANTFILTEVFTFTVLALVTQEALRAVAGGLVALIDGAAASVLADVFTRLQVTLWPSKAGLTATGRSACEM